MEKSPFIIDTLRLFGDKILSKNNRKLKIGDSISYNENEYEIEDKLDISFVLKPKAGGDSITVDFIDLN